ncbi:SET domain protein [Coprinopsis marcescibilis]|uniref:SET domain protein n=1 Tax=Coprinopsis marcescibilis TaxID=230819 RepID=A0A5C3KW42_COPMA|nr:SET domain protein [Coprinopsis marcescibilis]
MTRNQPSNWPSEIVFRGKSTYHSSVTGSIKTYLLSFPIPSSTIGETNTPCKVLIRKIQDVAHPANGQCGLFAGQKIGAATFIIDYIGEIHTDDRPESDYDLSLARLEDGTSIGVDASHMGNEARFVNDYRGIRRKHNAQFSEYRTRSGELRICIRSCEDIKKGEEILVSYGKSWWKARESFSGYSNACDHL